MHKISFFLRQPDASTETAVLMIYRCVDGKLKYYTGVSINPIDWIFATQSTTNKKVNARIGKIEKAMVNYCSKMDATDQPVTRDGLRDMLDRLLKERSSKPQTDTTSLIDRFRVIADRMESGVQLTPKGRKRYTAGTVKCYRHHINILEAYNPDMVLDSIDMKSYNNFIVWCQKRNFSKNYIGAIIKSWKSLCKIAGRSLPDEFCKISEESTDIALSEEDINCMFSLKLAEREANARDWFILACYTGVRSGDLTALQDENIIDGYIATLNNKTGEDIKVPQHRLVKEILKKHKGLPPKVSDVEINRIIKIVAKKAGINKFFLDKITKGGELISNMTPSYKKISLHTARRTFITNLRANGLPDSVIMKLSGITSSATLKKYDKLTPEKAGNIAAMHPFFK